MSARSAARSHPAIEPSPRAGVSSAVKGVARSHGPGVPWSGCAGAASDGGDEPGVSSSGGGAASVEGGSVVPGAGVVVGVPDEVCVPNAYTMTAPFPLALPAASFATATTSCSPAATAPETHDHAPPDATALHTTLAPTKTLTVAPSSAVPVNVTPSVGSGASADGEVITGGFGASRSRVSLEAALASEIRASDADIAADCVAVTVRPDADPVPPSAHDHCPEAATFSTVQLSPFDAVAVTFAPGKASPDTGPFVTKLVLSSVGGSSTSTVTESEASPAAAVIETVELPGTVTVQEKPPEPSAVTVHDDAPFSCGVTTTFDPGSAVPATGTEALRKKPPSTGEVISTGVAVGGVALSVGVGVAVSSDEPSSGDGAGSTSARTEAAAGEASATTEEESSASARTARSGIRSGPRRSECRDGRDRRSRRTAAGAASIPPVGLVPTSSAIHGEDAAEVKQAGGTLTSLPVTLAPVTTRIGAPPPPAGEGLRRYRCLDEGTTMTLSLTADDGPYADPAPWRDPAGYWASIAEATADLDPPFGVLHLGALRFNAHDMLRRAGGVPLRVASKSIRVRDVLHATLALDGYAGVLAYTLPEALWLADTVDDVVVGYPTADRAALRRLAGSPELSSCVTIMVDSLAHLDLVDAVAPPRERETIRVCIEIDVSLRSAAFGHVGVWRSPLRTPQEVRALAEEVVRRDGFELVGLMGYESQVAGIGDRIPGRAPRNALIGSVQRRSVAELSERRAAAVALVREIAPLEFVNGGGTGSIESTARDDSVTEVAAGSGLFAGHIFDNYTAFHPAPAAAFALPVVRKPRPDMATVLGGGWTASGPPGVYRLPSIVWPQRLSMVAREMAGEVQTPVTGPDAAALAAGDRVWLRHAKSGELSEHLSEFVVVDDGRVVDRAPTYRGEGMMFL